MAEYEVVIDWLMDGEVAKTVLHYELVSGTFDGQELADEIYDQFSTAYREVLVPSITYEGVTTRLDIPGGVGQTYTPTSGPLAGLSVNDQYAHVLALLVTKRGDNTVRPNKGRIYQPGLSSELLGDDGRWVNGARTACFNFWLDMVTLILPNTANLRMVIKSSNPTAPNTVAYNPVVSIGTASNPATQRRRRIGTGV